MQQQNTSLIITTISAPNDAIKNYAVECEKRKINFIVIGDSATPDEYKNTNCDFYSIQKQKSELPFSLAKILPEKKYSRKNLGYLIAIKNNTDVIIETDDDNFQSFYFFLHFVHHNPRTGSSW